MTMLKGKFYYVSTVEQFINQTDFTAENILEAQDEASEAIEEFNEIHEEESDFNGPAESVDDLDDDHINEWISKVGTVDAIKNLLEEDDRKWIYRYDDLIHTIVEVQHK